MKIVKYKDFKINESVSASASDLNNWDYEYVKTDTLWEYKEFDRSKDIKNSDSLDNIKRLEEILREEGFNQPLILQYSKKYQTAYLTEGNHRLIASKNIGIKYIPVRVTTDGGEKKDAKRVYYSVDNPTLPSQIGIESYDKEFNLIYSEDEDENYDIDYNDVLSSYKDIESFQENSDGSFNISVNMRYHDVLLLLNSEECERIEACMNHREYSEKETIWKNINFKNFASTYREKVDDDFYSNYRNTIYKSFLRGGFETPFDGHITWKYDNIGIINGIIIKNELLEEYNNIEGYNSFLECMIDNYDKGLIIE